MAIWVHAALLQILKEIQLKNGIKIKQKALIVESICGY